MGLSDKYEHSPSYYYNLPRLNANQQTVVIQNNMGYIPAPALAELEAKPQVTTIKKVLAAIGIVTAVLGAGAAGVNYMTSRNNAAADTPAVTQIVTYNCVDERSKALETLEQHPGVTEPYAGELESQCHINAAIEQQRAWVAQNQQVAPAGP